VAPTGLRLKAAHRTRTSSQTAPWFQRERSRPGAYPLLAASKTGKSDFIEIMNGEFIQGRVKLDSSRCLQLADEYGGLIWDERSATEEPGPS